MCENKLKMYFKRINKRNVYLSGNAICPATLVIRNIFAF